MPLVPLFVERSACALPVNATTALGTVAPVWSVTVPRMLPLVAVPTGSPSPPQAARMTAAAIAAGSAIVGFMNALPGGSSTRSARQPFAGGTLEVADHPYLAADPTGAGSGFPCWY